MRRTFAIELHKQMQQNDKIIVIVADLGYGMFDKIRDDFPGRFYNVGAAEQCMLGVAIGLALEGKIPVCYSITPFLIYRGFELIKNYINHEKIPVKLIGAGMNDDYKHDGVSHWAWGIPNLFYDFFEDITTMIPLTKDNVIYYIEKLLELNKPIFLILER